MSGHSKWSTIKRKKGAADQKRGKIFTRCIHEITIAVKEGGGGDPNGNPRLRLAVDKAKACNMPNENIDRAIRRATGEIGGDEQQELTYEGYGPGGAAVLIHVLTDNKNRSVSDIRHAFTRCGGSLGENGCVAWMFRKRGVLSVKKETAAEDEVLEAALDAGSEDVVDGGELWEIFCDQKQFATVKSALEAKMAVEQADIQMIPQSSVSLSGKEAEQMLRLLEALDDMDDVLDVSCNADFPELNG
jgi:YebC/PmpR family DNA-binding regulatory protein